MEHSLLYWEHNTSDVLFFISSIHQQWPLVPFLLKKPILSRELVWSQGRERNLTNLIPRSRSGWIPPPIIHSNMNTDLGRSKWLHAALSLSFITFCVWLLITEKEKRQFVSRSQCGEARSESWCNNRFPTLVHTLHHRRPSATVEISEGLEYFQRLQKVLSFKICLFAMLLKICPLQLHPKMYYEKHKCYWTRSPTECPCGIQSLF